MLRILGMPPIPPSPEPAVQSFLLLGALALAAVLVVVGAIVIVRRRRRGDRDEGSSVFPPSSSGEGARQVRLLEGDDTARQARIEALRGEVKSLRREATYASQRGLDRRAERLESLISEREEQLKQFHERAS